MKKNPNQTISPFARNLKKHIVPYIKPIMDVNENLIQYITNLEGYLAEVEERLKKLENPYNEQ
jgi:hypothetical protein